MQVSKLLYGLLGIPLIIFAYIAFTNNGEKALWMLPFLVGMAIVYVLRPQIDWYFIKKFPPELPEEFVQSLKRAFPFYEDLTPDQRERFNNRVTWIKMSKDFSPNPDHSIPYDVSFGMASCVAALTFHFDDYRLKDYEKVVVYKTSFPSPAYPRDIHACEVNHEDKVVLIATDKFMMGQNKPQEYFNTALYVWSMVVEHVRKSPELPEHMLEKVAKVLKFRPEAIKAYIGTPDVNDFALASTAYFMQPQSMKKEYPELFQKMDGYYRNPG
ncbi:MAG TPA: zinc-dependent peptidase [Saprospiraceae bacterium]|nr:zinc-dependent peptidase [Saprospiraceae bacterium]